MYGFPQSPLAMSPAAASVSLPGVSVSRADIASVRGRLRAYQARYAPFFGRRELRGKCPRLPAGAAPRPTAPSPSGTTAGPATRSPAVLMPKADGGTASTSSDTIKFRCTTRRPERSS